MNFSDWGRDRNRAVCCLPLSGYFYHPDFNVCGYVYAGMAYWPRDFVAGKIAELIRVRGTTANMIRLGLNNEAVLAELGE